jgi:hypothetical protein
MATSEPDWAQPCHVCAGTGLSPATSAPGLGAPLPRLRRDWAHPCHVCAGTDRFLRGPLLISGRLVHRSPCGMQPATMPPLRSVRPQHRCAAHRNAQRAAFSVQRARCSVRYVSRPRATCKMQRAIYTRTTHDLQDAACTRGSATPCAVPQLMAVAPATAIGRVVSDAQLIRATFTLGQYPVTRTHDTHAHARA